MPTLPCQVALDVFHVDKAATVGLRPAKRKAKRAKEAAIVSNFIKTAADQQMLTFCNAWVLNPSGFVRNVAVACERRWHSLPCVVCCVVCLVRQVWSRGGRVGRPS